MNGRMEDRRVRKTKKALRESLAVLLTKKNIRDISVQELADHADLNRATFYLHYKDIYDLQQQIETETMYEVNQILDQYMPTKDGGDPLPLFVQLLAYIQENDDLCKMLLGVNSNRSFLDKLCTIVEEKCLYNWLNTFRTTESAEDMLYFSSYIVHGYVAVIAKWVQSGMNTSPEALAKLMSNMGLHGLSFLENRQ